MGPELSAASDDPRTRTLEASPCRLAQSHLRADAAIRGRRHRAGQGGREGGARAGRTASTTAGVLGRALGARAELPASLPAAGFATIRQPTPVIGHVFCTYLTRCVPVTLVLCARFRHGMRSEIHLHCDYARVRDCDEHAPAGVYTRRRPLHLHRSSHNVTELIVSGYIPRNTASLVLKTVSSVDSPGVTTPTISSRAVTFAS
jgi:hypothetical protein